MGKLKTKYPLELEVDFMLFLQTSELIRDSYSIDLLSGNLEYVQVKEVFEEFMHNHQIGYEAYMFFQSVHSEREELLHVDWSLGINEIEDNNRYIIIKVKSHTQHLKDFVNEQFSEVTSRLNKLQEKINSSREKEEFDGKCQLPSPMLHHNSSISQVSIPSDKDLDIGVLFSQPIFDEKRHQQANMPVDFRSELQRLYSALNNSYKPEITVECQIATKQHLKHLIAYKRPKILHIICHGSSLGELEFEDDSKFSIGALSLIQSEKIRQILLAKKDLMPSLVFINSCHSELIGNIFYQAGAKYCIMIDSQDKIDDEAAQIFSQNFYRNIFRGEKVGTAFREAKDTVKIKHNSSGCCCRHTSRQQHKPDCRWLKICASMGHYEAHKIYHIPSSKCNCQLRNINQHDLKCQWAQFALFHINNDFRIMQNGVERFPKKVAELPKYLPQQKKKQMLLICCCFNFVDNGIPQIKPQFRIPHSESNKFKMLPADSQNSESLYELQKNVAFRTQIIDYSAPQLTQYYEKVQNSSVMGRQQQLYEFMKMIRENQLNLFILYGHPGIGKTTFAIKAATYLIERRVFQIYFFIDLYDIKDTDMFRNKFNEVTKLDYPYNKASINEVKNKPIIIVFDNVDEFCIASIEEFQNELQNLKKQFIHAKFILTCKQKNVSVLQNEKIFMNINSTIKQLKPLDQNTAAKALYMKIRNYLDISISFLDIRQIVGKKPELQIPKVIQNLSHSFSHTKGKIKLQALKQKVNELGQGDLAFNKLVQENLNILKARCKMSYQMLIFISQFSQGIDKNDFSILGSYDRTDNKADSFGVAVIDIPIDKNWKKRLANLFQKYKESNSEVTKTDSESQTLQNAVSLQKHQTSIHSQDSGAAVDQQSMFQGQSYFLQEVSRNRYIVKRFIRDFIWNKDKSQENYYMKHIFVAYTAVMLDIYLSFLVNQNYIHEELLEYSDISQTGIFKFKDNNYKKPLLTESIRYVEDYNSKFERILKQQPALRQKIRSSDPSVFIMNHKLDFLHIYGYDWGKVYQYLVQNKKKQASILINYLQRLVILIPTAMKVANLEQTLIKYSIRQSINLLSQIRLFSKPVHTLMLTLKLKLMKTASQIEKGEENCLAGIQFQKQLHKTDLQSIDSENLKSIHKQWGFQTEIINMYIQYVKIKKQVKSSDNALKVTERIADSIKKIQEMNSDKSFETECQCQLLIAKRQLLQAMIYIKVLQLSGKYPMSVKIANFKSSNNLITFIRNSLSAAKIFHVNKMMKLSLRAKLLAVSINWEQLKVRVKQNQFSRELQKERTLLRQCQQLYQDKNNNLIGLTIYDGLMKKIRKEMKDKMWQESANNLVIMKAVPLSNKNSPLLEHIVRTKQKYKKELESIFLHAEIDLSIKFQILNAEKLEEQTKRESTILLLSTSFRTKGGKVYLICEDNDLKEKDIEINADFFQKYPLYNTKLLILMGTNASQGFKKLTTLFPKGPSIIAITSSSTSQFDEFEEYNYEQLYNKTTALELRKAIEHNLKVDQSEIQFAKAFIKQMIKLNPKNYQQGIKDIYLELWHQNKQNFQNFKIEIRESSRDIIKLIKGSFKDLSPSFRKTHNIDCELKNPGSSCIYRKWKEINQVFKEFTNNKKQTKYIQICGSNGAGKSTFIQEIGRMCIERNLFESGVYIINGKQVEEKNQSDFESYIIKAAESSNMFNLQSFNKYANSNFLLMIDDFHLIRPRSNGRYNLFLKKLIQKKVNVIFVTHENFNMRDLLPSIWIRTVKIQKLKGVELDIFAYHVFRAQNTAAFEEYEKQKLKRVLNCSEIMKINDRNLESSYNNYLRPEQQMRKLISNKN